MDFVSTAHSGPAIWRLRGPALELAVGLSYLPVPLFTDEIDALFGDKEHSKHDARHAREKADPGAGSQFRLDA
jgi:hypothetical protein